MINASWRLTLSISDLRNDFTYLSDFFLVINLELVAIYNLIVSYNKIYKNLDKIVLYNILIFNYNELQSNYFDLMPVKFLR